MNFEEKQQRREGKVWWSKKRVNYNVSLLVSGTLAFILYVLVMEFIVFNSDKIKSHQEEITILTIFFQGFGYLMMMGFANIVFYGVSGSEFNSKLKDVIKSREKIYSWLLYLSCSLPFLIPLLLFFKYI